MTAGTARWYGPSKRERLTIGQQLAEQAAVAPNVQTGDYTLVAADAGRSVEVDKATAATITVPAGVFTPGQKVRIVQIGAGLVTLAAGSGLTLNSPTTLKSAGQWSSLVVAFRSGSTAVLSGGIAAT